MHPVACAEPSARRFLAEWVEKPKCWLCDNTGIVRSSSALITEMVQAEASADTSLFSAKRRSDTCLSAHLLALFASTKSGTVQTWRFYEFGLEIVETCQFDEGTFWALFGITPAQITYVFYLIGLAFDLPSSRMALQAPEGAQTGPSAMPAWDAPLVIDVGMGLGADTRYYLSQGFRVVAVEANPLSVSAALTVDWVKPFLHSGQLSVLNAAVALPGEGGGTTTLFTVPQRPEQSHGNAWVAEAAGNTPIAVRAVECADLLRVFGRPEYLKVDIESSTEYCLASLHKEFAGSSAAASARSSSALLPKELSLEVEATNRAPVFLQQLRALGYAYYKMCRQYVYSPAPCEQGAYSSKVKGCGAGPFGDAAVDYLAGTRWRPLDELENDTGWAREFEGGLDWFDLHARLPD